MGTSKNDYPDDLVRGLMTRPDASEALLDDPAEGETNGQSRGGKRKSPRRGRPPKEKRKGRNLKLSESVFERLQLEAIKKKWSVSDVAQFILDGALPKHAIKTED